MTLSKKIEDHLYEVGEKLTDQTLDILMEAQEVLDSYRFVSSRLLKDNTYEMQMLERWAPNHHANIVGDAE
jgi:hypothetical protein